MGFTLVDKYLGTRLGTELGNLPRGQVTVVESLRRMVAETSYGFVHAVWWAWLDDGRSIISVPPGVGTAVAGIMSSVGTADSLTNPAIAIELQSMINSFRKQRGLPETDRVLHDSLFACNGDSPRPQLPNLCQMLHDESIPATQGIHLPTHCFPDGTVYGVLEDNMVVSVAYAHRIGEMEEQVADIGVETAPDYRRRGYARAAVSAVLDRYIQRGGEAVYSCASSNTASSATARSVGFVPFAKRMAIAAPSPE